MIAFTGGRGIGRGRSRRQKVWCVMSATVIKSVVLWKHVSCNSIISALGCECTVAIPAN